MSNLESPASGSRVGGTDAAADVIVSPESALIVSAAGAVTVALVSALAVPVNDASAQWLRAAANAAKKDLALCVAIGKCLSQSGYWLGMSMLLRVAGIAAVQLPSAGLRLRHLPATPPADRTKYEAHVLRAWETSLTTHTKPATLGTWAICANGTVEFRCWHEIGRLLEVASTTEQTNSIESFLSAFSITLQVVLADESGSAADCREWRSILPAPWRDDIADAEAMLATLSSLHAEPDLSPTSIFAVLHRPLFTSLVDVDVNRVLRLRELAEWLQLPVVLTERLDVHSASVQLRASLPTDFSFASLRSRMTGPLAPLWASGMHALPDTSFLRYDNDAARNAGLVGAASDSRIPLDALCHVVGRIIGGHAVLLSEEVLCRWTHNVGVCDWNEGKPLRLCAMLCEMAVAADRVDVLQALCVFHTELPLNERMFDVAAARGHLRTLQWLSMQDTAPPSWAGHACEAAALAGHLHVLKWLRERDPGRSWGSDMCTDFEQLALGAHDYYRRWRPCPCGHAAVTLAAQGGHLHVLQWLRAQCPTAVWGAGVCTSAARHNQIAVLQWLRLQDRLVLEERTASAAAGGGHLLVLQWLLAQDPPCPLGGSVCAAASLHGRFHILSWLRAQTPPCPWDARTILVEYTGWPASAAAQWARDHGCPTRLPADFVDMRVWINELIQDS